MRLKFRIEEKGGAGSGNFGHAGRPGKVGGSAPGSGGGTGTYDLSSNEIAKKLKLGDDDIGGFPDFYVQVSNKGKYNPTRQVWDRSSTYNPLKIGEVTRSSRGLGKVGYIAALGGTGKYSESGVVTTGSDVEGGYYSTRRLALNALYEHVRGAK